MFKLSLLFILISTLTWNTHAQAQYTKSTRTYEVHPGTVTTLDGQIIKGYILNRNPEQNQNSCIFYSDYKDVKTKKTFKPTEIAAYTIENDQYKSIPYSGNIGIGKGDQQFVYIAQPGIISTYIYYSPEEQILWQKGSNAPVSNAAMMFGFKKNVLKLVGDDLEIAGKINNKVKGYGLLSINQIINEYNLRAAEKSKVQN